MTIDEILEQLSNHPEGSFPHAAINAAVEQQAAITPHLLAYLQELVDLGEEIDDDFDDGLTLTTATGAWVIAACFGGGSQEGANIV